jgi:hypothetical protein
MNDSASPLSSLDLPGRIIKLLEEGGVNSIDILVARLEEDPKSILSIAGIGSKTLLNISSALKAFKDGQTEQYPEPVQSLGDQFKSMLPEEPMAVELNAEDQEVIKKDEKKKGKKSKKGGKKKDKKSKKAGIKKSEKPDKKKVKKPKKGKGKKNKKNKKK